MLRSVVPDLDAADLRWTVDTPADLALVRRIYETSGRRPAATAELLAWLREHPDVAAINADIEQKPH